MSNEQQEPGEAHRKYMGRGKRGPDKKDRKRRKAKSKSKTFKKRKSRRLNGNLEDGFVDLSVTSDRASSSDNADDDVVFS